MLRHAEAEDGTPDAERRLTKKGEGVLKKLDRPVLDLHEKLMAGLSKSEVKQLVGLMEKLAGKMRGCE